MRAPLWYWLLMDLSPTLAIEVLVLLAVANGTPVLATWLLGERWAAPLDGGIAFLDGRPLLGRSKTVRGVITGVMATGAAAPALGWSWQLGLGFGAASMAGDLFSSFVKRRIGIQASGQATGLDQIPEALFPLLACRGALGLDGAAVALLVALFTAAQLAASPLMYRLGIRRRPY